MSPKFPIVKYFLFAAPNKIYNEIPQNIIFDYFMETILWLYTQKYIGFP